jgi:hypothetical protein
MALPRCRPPADLVVHHFVTDLGRIVGVFMRGQRVAEGVGAVQVDRIRRSIHRCMQSSTVATRAAASSNDQPDTAASSTMVQIRTCVRLSPNGY